MNILFAAFDVFPTAKGSTTHIAHTLHALKKVSGSLTLASLGHGDMPRFQEEGHLSIRRCLAMHPNFLRRTELFGDFLFDLLDGIREKLDVIHFRDIWSGIPLLEHPNTQSARKIFEVNGLLSIELPMHYPRLYQNPVLMSRIRMMEDRCLAQADHIITVSRTNANYIQSRHIAAEKITVIPNIAEIHHDNVNSPIEGHKSNSQFILYAGTLTPWQGITTLINAFNLIADRECPRLILACSTKKFLRPIRKQIKKLQLQERVEVKIGLLREHLHAYYRKAVFSIVPLTRCDRNELQGCCPLKILESMAAGTPVIASNLAVCRELVEHGTDGWLVSPDSPRALAQAMLTLLDNPDLVSTLGQKAQQKIAHCYNRETFTEKLLETYLHPTT